MSRGTPFVTFLGPSDLSEYDRSKRPDQQPSTIPQTFIDAMEVRESVFVHEQGVPLENEFDSDDARSCHWVVYASINTTTDPEVTDGGGSIIQRKRSVTRTTPIGTIRLVPFPHAPHPEPGSTYSFDASEDQSTIPPKYTVDRATTYHDGVEPYIKLGRMAVIKEFRGAAVAAILANAAITWAQENPNIFNTSIAETGTDKLGAMPMIEIPLWIGLVCTHAQTRVEEMWTRWGFKRDEKMGTWTEEGITHVGMFRRLELKKSLSS